MVPTISVTRVNHFFGTGALRRQVLFEVSADISAGEIVIAMGPSGSGKTTLLTLIGALRSTQDGSVRVLGTELKDAGAHTRQRARQSIGFIFQSHNLLASLTALENVQLRLELDTGLRPETARSRSLDMLEEVGLGDCVNRRPHELSGGQKQRVAIARAVVHRPAIVLADEPTAALDKQTGREVVDILRRLAKQHGCSILFVTHDTRILDIADRLLTLEDGRLTA